MLLKENASSVPQSLFIKCVIAAIVLLFSISFVFLVLLSLQANNLKCIESLVYIMLMAIMVLVCRVNVLSIMVMAVLATIATDEEFIFKIIDMLIHDIK